MFETSNQTWDNAVARNTKALASLVALLAAYGGVDAVKVPRAVRSTVLLVLRPAESALRRLIVIAARKVKLDLPAPKAKPSQPGAKTRPKDPNARSRSSSSQSFQLFDPRKRMGRRSVRYFKVPPRVLFFAPDPPLVPFFARPPEPAPAPVNTDIGAHRLCQRLKAMSKALEDINNQARRLVRLRLLRERKNSVLSPLRIGTPPGHRNRPSRSIDFILAECHRYAQGVLAEPRTPQAPNPPAPNTS
jgi:hypothetical protein